MNTKKINYFIKKCTLLSLLSISSIAFSAQEIDKLPNNINNLQQWANYIKEENKDLNCAWNQNISHCSFLSHADILYEEDKIVLNIKGYQLNQLKYKIPTILVNNYEIPFKLNDSKIKITEINKVKSFQTEDNDIDIKFTISNQDLKSLGENVNNIQKIDLKFKPSVFLYNSHKNLKLNLENQIVLVENQKNIIKPIQEETKEIIQKEDINIKVFRKYTENNPTLLETQLDISYFGKKQKINIGKVIPSDFHIFNIIGAKNITVENQNNEYILNLQSGQHKIKFYSFSNKIINQINIENLVLKVDKEIWSIQKNSNIRNYDILDTPLNPEKAQVPREWQSLPSYLFDKKIDFKTNSIGLNESKHLFANISRTTWLGFDGKFINLDKYNIENQNNQFLKIKSDVNLLNFKINNNYQTILQENKEKGVLIPNSNFNGQYVFETESAKINSNILESDININSWNIVLPSRTRLLHISSEDKIFNDKKNPQGTIVQQWDLYNIFFLFLIVLSFYKLVGKEMAIFSLIGLLLLQSFNVFSWALWVCLLLFYIVFKIIKQESSFYYYLKLLLLIFSVSFFLQILHFSYKEIQYIINPSLENMRFSVENTGMYYFKDNQQDIFVTTFSFLFFFYFIYLIIEIFKNKILTKLNKVLGIIGLIIISSILFSFVTENKKNRYYQMEDTESVYAQRDQSNDVAVLGGMPQKKARMLSDIPMPASAPPMELTESSNMLKKEMIENNINKSILEKNHIGKTTPNFYGNNYKLSLISDKITNNDLTFWVIPSWAINIIGVLQILFLFISLIFFASLLFNDDKWKDKLISLSKNSMYQKIILACVK